jgi:hypothetical protein
MRGLVGVCGFALDFTCRQRSGDKRAGRFEFQAHSWSRLMLLLVNNNIVLLVKACVFVCYLH